MITSILQMRKLRRTEVKKKLAQSHTARKLASRFQPGSLDPESVLLDTKSAASLPMEMITV